MQRRPAPASRPIGRYLARRCWVEDCARFAPTRPARRPALGGVSCSAASSSETTPSSRRPQRHTPPEEQDPYRGAARGEVPSASPSRAKQEPSPFLKVRLGRRKDHQELEVLDDVDETVLGKLGYEGDRPGLYRLSLPLDFELSTPREHVVDLVLGVRRLMIGFPREEAVNPCAEHPRAQELPPLIACGACRLDDLVEL